MPVEWVDLRVNRRFKIVDWVILPHILACSSKVIIEPDFVIVFQKIFLPKFVRKPFAHIKTLVFLFQNYTVGLVTGQGMTSWGDYLDQI